MQSMFPLLGTTHARAAKATYTYEHVCLQTYVYTCIYLLCKYTYAWPKLTLLGMTLHISDSPSTDVGPKDASTTLHIRIPFF